MPHRAPRAVARRTVVLAGLAGLALGGCGQKGPLFFPEDRAEEEKKSKDKDKRSSLGRRSPIT